jgi:hypothetical protein
VIQYQLDSEKKVLDQLTKQYQKALNDIERKIRILQSDELTQSRIYRIEHQKVLKKQVEAVLEKLHADEYTTIQQFLSDSYTDAFVGTAYDMFGQGVPLILPIDRNAAVKAVTTDSKINAGLYEALGVDAKKLKTTISAEITRGLASDTAHSEIARNIANIAKVPFSRAKTIVRTESHRIQQASKYDAQQSAIKKGANVVKQWNSTLDGSTRPTHQRLDGQIREVDEFFEMDGKKAKYPGDFGDPAEDCNCRCQLLQRARIALDEDELNALKKRAAFFGLDKADDLEDFKKKYLNAEKNVELPLEKDGKNGIIISEKGASISGKILSDDLKERSKQIDSILNDYTERSSKWSGTTRVLPRADMIGVSGKKDWSCDIVLREDAGVKTAIHEHLHARSVSHYNEIAFVRWYNAEEGAVELYARSICKKNGVAFRTGSYDDLVKQLMIVHSITEEFEDDFAFAKAFYEVDLINRYTWLKELAEKSISKGKLTKATINALSNAVETFRRKM